MNLSPWANALFLLTGFLFLAGPGILLIGLIFPEFNFRWKIGLGMILDVILLGVLILGLNTLNIKINYINLLIGIFVFYLCPLAGWLVIRYLKIRNKPKLSKEQAWKKIHLKPEVGLVLIFFTFIIISLSFLGIQKESFTEFYVDLKDVPWRENNLLDPFPLRIHVVSHEKKASSYTVQVQINEEIIENIPLGVLKPGERIERVIYIPHPDRISEYRIYLFKDNIPEIYRRLHFWVK